MCGRYYVDDGVMEDIRRIVDGVELALKDIRRVADGAEREQWRDEGTGGFSWDDWTGDIYPSRPAPVLLGAEDKAAAEAMRWGFPPYGGKGLLINARAETLLEKRTFRESARRRRCILPARHFYEWNQNREKAVCYQPGRPTLYLAGCYDQKEGENRFVVITTQANETLQRVHGRMPLLLKEEELGDWLFNGQAAEAMLRRAPAEAEYEMEVEQLSLFDGEV